MHDFERILIFDPDYTGHHFEFLDHFVNYFCNSSLQVKLFLLVHETYNLKESNASIKMLPIANSVVDKHKSCSLISRSLAEVSLALNTSATHNIDNLILLSADHLLFGLIRYTRRTQQLKSIFALIFAPYPQVIRYQLSRRGIKIKTSYRYLYKFVLFRTAALLTSVKFGILNDSLSVTKLINSAALKDRVVLVPDPIPSYTVPIKSGSQKRKRSQSEQNLIICGVIDDRKSVRSMLHHVRSLNESGSTLYKLKVVGECRDSALSELLHKSAIESPEYLSLKLNRVSLPDLVSELINADIIIALYKNFYGSSGIVNHAAFLNKPVIVYKSSLAGDIVRGYHLGAVVNELDEYESLKQALHRITTRNVNVNNIAAAEYVATRSPKAFVESIIGHALK